MNKPTSLLRRWLLPSLLIVCAFGVALAARAAEVIPQVPTGYFNDYALAVKPETAERLNHELADFERQTSNQLQVAIFSKMQTDSSIDDYCTRVFRAWKVGQTGKSNGAVLFVFVQDHKLHIQTGYGLEGALPDATCKDIISDVISPKLKAGDFDGGMTAGVEAMIQVTKGEYKGSGHTNYDNQQGGTAGGGWSLGTIIFILFVIYLLWSSFRRSWNTPGGNSGGRGTMFGGGPVFLGGGFGGGSSSSERDDSPSSSGGGDFFSGGGGSTGGGGASGDW